MLAADLTDELYIIFRL